jgi:hypothetical protein
MTKRCAVPGFFVAGPDGSNHQRNARTKTGVTPHRFLKIPGVSPALFYDVKMSGFCFENDRSANGGVTLKMMRPPPFLDLFWCRFPGVFYNELLQPLTPRSISRVKTGENGM